MGLHQHLYNEHLPCISSSHLHWEARACGLTETFFSVLERLWECNRVQAKLNKSPQDAPSPHHSHTPQSSWPWKSTALSLVRSSTSNRSRGAGTTEVSGLYNPGACRGDQKGWCDAFWAPPSLVQQHRVLSPDHGEDELEGIGNETAHPSSLIESCA